MPILKTLTTPNGVTASFHKPTSAEISYRDAVAVVRVASWVDQAAHDAGAGQVWLWPMTLSIPEVADVEAALIVAGLFAGGSLLADESGGLDARRNRQWALIKQQREQREYGGFTWDGSRFDSNPDARARIAGAVMEAQATGASFSRTWRLADDTLRVLDAQQMLAVGIALGAHVGHVFAIGNDLYEQIQASSEPEAVTWPIA